MRGTIRTLLVDHDVFVADWRNARDVPPSAGRFGLDEYIEHLMEFLEAIGGAHLMAVCQPCVPAMAATALMAEDDHPAQPRSLILVAGPVDARVNPGRVNRVCAASTPSPRSSVARSSRFRGRTEARVDGSTRASSRSPASWAWIRAGTSRRSPGSHETSRGATTPTPQRSKEFYDEYFAVLDIAAEFYLDTARAVFMDHDLARGQLQWRGRAVDPGAIRTALMTIEAENDEMCCPGQTRAAHDLCTGIPAARKRHHLQPGVGHYGVFTGTRFEGEIAPEITKFVAANERPRRAKRARA